MASYHYKGRYYQAAHCEHCEATVTMTMATFWQLVMKASPYALDYFDTNIHCCERPDYYWRPNG